MDYNWFVIFTCAILGAVSSSDLGSESVSNITTSDDRQGREFPFYSLGRIANRVCTGTNGLLGTCQIRGECASNGGIGSGRCSTLTVQAVCCVYISTCGGSGSNNVTYFQNAGYPMPYNGGGACTYTVIPPDSTVCQLRVDFSAFTLSQPNGDGLCSVDNIQIFGGSSRVPTICGDNNGQHVYVNFNGQNSITITVSTTAATSFNRLWNLQLSMISCTSTYIAPAGCLQYFLDSAGNIQSFNYGSSANSAFSAMGMVGTRQMSNQNYGICIRAGADQCSISYNVPSGDLYAFTVTGDVLALTQDMLGTPGVAMVGSGCMSDYLIIPNPTGVASDRFCGMAIEPVTSSPPFVLYYITDSSDGGDVANRGFSLQYSQNSCPISAKK
ncbi:uncharacterized protein LOC110676121 [Aedes aegypti]|uniref:CUB domain-containing protein n=1 Tax=Aedes aegypti TaxID=7159 RepID=A0A6I8TX65_AEDAE|nr:uncharacterized protein LOC110676121 [Aedes aegypti]